jgi:hypothetical protein
MRFNIYLYNVYILKHETKSPCSHQMNVYSWNVNSCVVFLKESWDDSNVSHLPPKGRFLDAPNFISNTTEVWVMVRNNAKKVGMWFPLS